MVASSLNCAHAGKEQQHAKRVAYLTPPQQEGLCAGSREKCARAVTGSSEVQITHMLYADDLCLASNQPDQLQLMLDRLHTYAQ
eukprot:1148761-Pelagomonas_calceolata.AAC.1